ncbi:MAG: hypothetical protein NTW86_20520 [Candidatus Sumerlaeota bacterium]|nr:hypothetical protein [Candidatus Sumerlaeota bacterium]
MAFGPIFDSQNGQRRGGWITRYVGDAQYQHFPTWRLTRFPHL